MWKRTGRPFEKVGENFLKVLKALPDFFPDSGKNEVAQNWEIIG